MLLISDVVLQIKLAYFGLLYPFKNSNITALNGMCFPYEEMGSLQYLYVYVTYGLAKKHNDIMI